jgi:NhaP-type Na+/H+ or K+/H+ antiporter
VETWSLAVVAVLVLSFAVVSRRLETTVLSAPMVFVIGGLVAGNEALGWIDLEIGSGAMRALAEVTLTLVLFADASRIDIASLRRELAFPARLLGIGLPLTVVAGALVAVGVLDELLVVEAVVLAIVLAPTDAALGQAVVTDQRLPSRIRQGLTVESGLNDGLCVPLLVIALAMAEADVGAVSAHDAVRLVLEEVGWGLAGGVVAGVAGAVALRLARRHGLVADEWAQVVPIASAALAYGLAAPMGGSGFIAAFAGGFAFGALQRGAGGEVSHLADASAQVLSAVTFVVFGAVVLGPALELVGWESVLYAILSLTVVRMIPVALGLAGSGARSPTIAYAGWFGPRGLASIVFAVIVIEEAELPHTELMLVTIAITVALSILAHGLTARPLTDTYVTWYASHPKPLPMEGVPVSEQRWRTPARLSSGFPPQ